MQYVPFGSLGFDVSRLGFGCMRFPTIMVEDKEAVDRPKAIDLLRKGIDGGISYLDTAYGYHGGESEVVVGLALKDGYREKVKLTTKLPAWAVNEEADMNKVLDTSLKRLDLPYLDFYILHAMNKEGYEKFQSLHYKDFMKQALKDGRIKHVGFSFHDNFDVFKMILQDNQWDMAQIQYNYLDDETQATEEGLKLAGKMGVPLVIMEPLRGGALANPPKNVADLIANHEKKRSAVEWAFGYVAQYAEVATILSGMSTEEQLMDNLRVFDTLTVGGMTEADMKFVKSLKEAYLSRMPVKCTGCEYCIPCPQDVRIPRIFAAYNDSKKFDRPQSFRNAYEKFIENGQDGSKCVQCGRCEGLCPQQLPIVNWLQQIDAEYKNQK